MRSLKFSNKNLLFNTYKRMLPLTVIFAIILLLGMPIACILVFSANFDVEAERFITVANAVAYVDGLGFMMASAAFGVFAGCGIMRSYMKRKSSVLFASIPVKREKLFAVNYLTGWLCYLSAAFAAVLLAIAVFAIFGVVGQAVGLLKCIGAGVIWFFFFYALTVFLGSLCGMSSIQIGFTAAALVYIPATVALIIFLAEEIYYKFLYLEHYLSMEYMEYYSPLIKLFNNANEFMNSTPDGPTVSALYSGVVAYGISAAVLTLLTVAVLRTRKHEKAGNSIVFPGVEQAVKYAAMIPCALLCGLIFYYVVYSVIAMVIGLIIGGVLAFMLMNVILRKNPRACFEGVKGLCVFAVCFAAMFSLIVFDPFGVDEYIPPANYAKSAVINLGGYDIEFTDPDDIAAVNRIMGAAQSSERIDNVEYCYYFSGHLLEDEHVGDCVNSMNVNVVYRLPSGFEISKNAYLWDISPVEHEIDTLMQSTEFRDFILERLLDYLDWGGGKAIVDYQTVQYTLGEVTGIGDVFAPITDSAAKRAVELIMESGVPMYSAEHGPQIATIDFGGGYVVPIYAEGHEQVLEYLSDMVKGAFPTDDIDGFILGFDKVTVGNEVVTDKAEMKEYFLSCAGFNARSSAYDRVENGTEIIFHSGDNSYTTYLYD